MLFAWITDPNAWLALGTLTLLEIVLGIDNIIFLSLVVAKLPTAQRAHARRIGLMGAMVMRLALLASIAWVVKLTNPLFTVFGQEISFRDLILLLGGLFLIWKASKEIHESIEGEEEGLKTNVHSFLGAIVQIMLLDIIFSLDSVITAVGLSDHLFIMMAAVVIAVGVMMFAARPIGDFVDRHPSVKMLALSFLILVGFTLMLESFDVHVPCSSLSRWRALTCCVIRKTRCKPQNCSLVTGCNPFSDFTAFYVSQIRLLIDGYGVQLLKRC